MSSLLDLIRKRRSIRSFDSKPVEREKLNAILEAGRLAPSARNEQGWHFFVATLPEHRAQMKDICNGQAFCGEAGAVLFVTTYKPRTMACGQPAHLLDASIALTCMMLMAEELGLGSCWIGNFDQAKARALLKLPEGEEVVGLMPIGYAKEQPQPRPRKSMDEVARFL
ncbi:MAG: nitroreductase [Fretibacterium sp.]|nr:nitroreductase [Fretibacterium sp.]